MLIAIQVPPASIFADKATGFVQAHRPPRQAVAGDKFDLGVRIVDTLMAAHLQTQPAGVRIQLQRGRPRAGVPGGQQIARLLTHKRTVARAHQAFCIGRWDGVRRRQKTTAALGKTDRCIFARPASARAGCGGIWCTHSVRFSAIACGIRLPLLATRFTPRVTLGKGAAWAAVGLANRRLKIAFQAPRPKEF